MNLTKVAISEKDAREAVRRIDSPETNGILDAITAGKHIIHLERVMKKVGTDRFGRPLLAIARVGWEEVEFIGDGEGFWQYSDASDVDRTFIDIPDKNLPWVTDDDLVATVPAVPQYIKIGEKDSAYILWEAQWRTSPIDDPFLLYRIGKSLLFTIEAQWDLTEVEKLLLG